MAISPSVDAFLDNAQRIFEVARSDDSAEPKDFALFIRPDGGLHFVMESPLGEPTAPEAAVLRGEARIAYRVTKSAGGEVRVTGRTGNRECILTQNSTRPPENQRFTSEWLRDQPRYQIHSAIALPASS